MSNGNKPRQINRQKASSHPLTGGGVYRGVVRSFVNSRPTIYVEQLGCTYTDIDFLGNTTFNKLAVNDQVLCTFIEGQTRELFVLGHFNKKTDLFVTVEKFNALIDALETQLNAIRAAFTPPLSPIDLESLKQPTT